MAPLTRLEKIELLAIPLAIGASWLLPLPAGFSLRIGSLLTAASLLLLLQGFCRDIWLWLAVRQATAKPAPRYAECMCVESAIGMTGVVVAIGLSGFSAAPEIVVRQPWFTAAVGAVLVAGFLLKDFVFEWNPWRIYREKDHATLHFRWKR
jgi:hypothetical protein